MIEYFHVYKDDELYLVTLSLSLASSTARSLSLEDSDTDIKVKSYLLDPKALEAMSPFVDDFSWYRFCDV